MKSSLCQIEDTDSGICVVFDSTEDAGFSIASEVYGASMGYSDEGSTYIVPVFEKIFEQFPSVPFEAHAECADGWVEQEYDVSNDGTALKINSIEIQGYNRIFKMPENGSDIETISEETGAPAEEIEELLS